MSVSYEKYCKEAAKEINYVNNWIATNTANKMRKKISRVYDILIDDFYSSFVPHYYRRQDTEPFKPEGINLYRALQEGSYNFNRLRPETGIIDGDVWLNANDMVEYNYKISKDIVLEYILNGIRFPSYQLPNGKYKEALTFLTEYSDNECSANGTILEILNSIRDQLGQVYAEESKSEAKKLNLKYVQID